MTVGVMGGEHAPPVMDESIKRDARADVIHLLTVASGGISYYGSVATSSGCVIPACRCLRALITWPHRVVAADGGERMTTKYLYYNEYETLWYRKYYIVSRHGGHLCLRVDTLCQMA